MSVVEGFVPDGDYCSVCHEELAYVYMVDENGNPGMKLCYTCYQALSQGVVADEE